MSRRALAFLIFALQALLLSASPALAQTPAWDTRNGFAVTCGTTANPVCAITSGPGCLTPAPVAGQCSFPKATAQAACVAHGACRAITCNRSRTDCQARGATELGNLVANADFDSAAIITSPTAAATAPVTTQTLGAPTTTVATTSTTTTTTTTAGTSLVPPALFQAAATALRALPLPDISGAADRLMTAAADITEPGGRWVSRTSGLYTLFINVTHFQTAILLYDGDVAMPFRSALQMGNTVMAKPIFVLSNIGGAISTPDLPPKLAGVIASTYYNQQSFGIQRGITQFGGARIGGDLGNVMSKMVGTPRNAAGQVELAVRWGYGPTSNASEPPPALAQDPPTTRAQVFAAWIDWYKGQLIDSLTEETGTNPTKQLVLQFWTKAGQRFNGPLGMSAVQVSDADITWSTGGNLKIVGNLWSSNKRLLAIYEGPWSVVQKLATLQPSSIARGELAELVFMASTPPSYTLRDHAELMSRLFTAVPWFPLPPAVIGGMATLAAPLNLFSIQNPLAQPNYTTGMPQPGVENFNLQFVGLKGEFGDEGKRLRVAGNLRLLGQPFGTLDVNLREAGLFVNATAGLNLPVVGGTLASATAQVDISSGKQEISLAGPLGLQGVPGTPTLRVDFRANEASASLGGSCYPISLNTTVGLANLSSLSGLLGGLSPSINNGEVCARQIVAQVCGSSGVGAVPGLGGACGAAGNTLVAGAYTVVNTFSSSINSVAGYINDAVNALKNVFAPDGKSLWQQAQEATGVGFVQLKNSASQLCLDVLDRNMGNGASLIQYRCEYRPNKFFYHDPVARRPGFGKLRINHSNKCLDVPQSRTDQGVRLIQFNCTDADNQLWQRDSNRKWRPFHAQHMCLHVEGGAEGAPAVLRNCQDNNGLQQFDGALVDPWMDQAVDARYYLSTHPDLRAAFGDPNNANAQARAVDHWRKFGMREGRQGRADFHIGHYIQQNGIVQPGGPVGTGQPISNAMEARNEYAVWHWISHGKNSARRASPSFGPLVPVHSAGANMCLTIEGNNGNNGQRLIMFNCNGGANQGFFFAHRGDGWGQLMARNSAKCIGIGAASMTPGAAAIQWDCGDTPDQQWRYEITSAGRGVYRNRNSNLCLDVWASGTTNGTAVVQWECHGRANQTLVEPPRPR